MEQRRERRFPATNITDVDCAEDLAFVADKCSDGEILLNTLKVKAKKVGLQVNVKKTEYIVLNDIYNIKSFDVAV